MPHPSKSSHSLGRVQQAALPTFRNVAVLKHMLEGFGKMVKRNAHVFPKEHAPLGGGAAGSRLQREPSLGRSQSGSSALLKSRSLTQRDQRPENRLPTALRKFGEVLEWLFLDCWLLSSGHKLANDGRAGGKGGRREMSKSNATQSTGAGAPGLDVAYLLDHLSPEVLKLLCHHVSGRASRVHYGSLLPHETHDTSAIAYVPGAVDGSQEKVPATRSFVLALMRRLRRLRRRETPYFALYRRIFTPLFYGVSEIFLRLRGLRNFLLPIYIWPIARPLSEG